MPFPRAAEGPRIMPVRSQLIDRQAAHEHHLMGSIGEAERPGRGAAVPNGFPIAIRVETMDAAVAAVGDELTSLMSTTLL